MAVVVAAGAPRRSDIPCQTSVNGIILPFDNGCSASRLWHCCIELVHDDDDDDDEKGATGVAYEPLPVQRLSNDILAYPMAGRFHRKPSSTFFGFPNLVMMNI